MPTRTIRDVIEGRRIFTASSHATVADAARLMRANTIGAVMIVDGGRLVGIVTERDVTYRVVAEDKDSKTTRVSAVMTRKPRTIAPDRPLGHALHMMYEGGFRHVPVVEDGRAVGMVSARDALGPDLLQFEAELIDREHIGEIL